LQSVARWGIASAGRTTISISSISMLTVQGATNGRTDSGTFFQFPGTFAFSRSYTPSSISTRRSIIACLISTRRSSSTVSKCALVTDFLSSYWTVEVTFTASTVVRHTDCSGVTSFWSGKRAWIHCTLNSVSGRAIWDAVAPAAVYLADVSTRT
jgi:hypothetical protein